MLQGKPSNYAIKRDLRRNTGFKPSFQGVGPLFWLLAVMKVTECHNKLGQLTSFEVSNTFLFRYPAYLLVKKIPGVVVKQKPNLFLSIFGPDVFCIFSIGDKSFELEEPFGDNSVYWVSESPARPSPELDLIRSHFASHTPISGALFWVPLIVFSAHSLFGIITALIHRLNS